MSYRKRDSGAAAVEMAFVTVFLLILVTGIIDVGRAIFVNISVQEAAQEGAFYGAFEPNVTEAQIVQRVIDSTSSPTISGSNVAVTCSTVSKSKMNGTRVQVEVVHDLDLLTPFVGQWLGGTIQLTKVAEAERFFETCPSASP